MRPGRGSTASENGTLHCYICKPPTAVTGSDADPGHPSSPPPRWGRGVEAKPRRSGGERAAAAICNRPATEERNRSDRTPRLSPRPQATGRGGSKPHDEAVNATKSIDASGFLPDSPSV